MAKVKEEATSVLMKVESITVDRTQYKPYTSVLSGQELYVEISLDDEDNLRKEGGKTILTTNGLAVMMSNVADAIDAVHEENRKTKFKV
jgi:hypothetical protein